MDLVVVQELNRAENLQGERLPSLQDPKPSHFSRDSNNPPLLPPNLRSFWDLHPSHPSNGPQLNLQLTWDTPTQRPLNSDSETVAPSHTCWAPHGVPLT